jgi:hypothetical protein|tara:strand:+ start:504 stop:734 length:231 start_codon:yes stop_codon:yes gene_type:complete
MAAEVTEATQSLPKEAGLVGLDGPLDQLDLTKMLAREFEIEEQGSEELEKEVLVNLDLSDVIANPPRRSSNKQKRT